MTNLTRRTALTGGLLALGGITLWTATRSARAQEQPLRPTIDEVMFDPANPVLGNPEGDVTIVEFFDYQCPYCKANHPVLNEVVEADGNVRLVMKDWPIFGAPSVRAAQLALGAASLDSYLTANDALMATEGRLDDTLIEETLAEAGLDVAALDAAYGENRDKWDGLLTRNGAQAAAFQLRGTPAFIIGTVIYPGAMDKAGLENAIAMARG
ncbi:protein-disulfide isomerase [Limimaricola soesokkakensis]|uniref:DSBA-like thioredoxin domain protein n=1 Tax=Limimaricola soesokkakensis TaxID=1343159 RepID=A0A1X7A3Y0_9RHOB|nr:DsbA family protein [Limimaricola soesokkakensis]PSK80844.1 protein-disulfide isomerase [Limimaricola soesokkakensis]SLN69798.1 DSBA-like thioredoxin domain protein [Limimaricola soesokkakensis]